MKIRASIARAVVCLLAILFLVSAAIAAPDTQEQRAGELSRVIPSVTLLRGGQSIAADTKTPVRWQDVVNTLAGGRARVSLDDGSTVNLGSDSNLRVVKHDAGAQQTVLTMGLGKIRIQAQKLSKPGGKFEVRTPAGVAGDRKSTRLNSSHTVISYAVFCLKKKKTIATTLRASTEGTASTDTRLMGTTTNAATMIVRQRSSSRQVARCGCWRTFRRPDSDVF